MSYKTRDLWSFSRLTVYPEGDVKVYKQKEEDGRQKVCENFKNRTCRRRLNDIL